MWYEVDKTDLKQLKKSKICYQNTADTQRLGGIFSNERIHKTCGVIRAPSEIYSNFT